MLDVALKFLVKELNAYLLSRTGSAFGEVLLGKVVDDTGKWTITQDHIGLSLVNVEEERVLRSQLPETVYTGGKHVTMPPPLKLNLHLIFAARFQQYDQALKYLALVLAFFQAFPAFKPDESPGLDPRIEKLACELQSLSYEQLNQVWAFIGAKQLPSVFYKVRMVVVQDAAQSSVALPLSQLDVKVVMP